MVTVIIEGGLFKERIVIYNPELVISKSIINELGR